MLNLSPERWKKQKTTGAEWGDYCNVALINQCTFPLIMMISFYPTQRSLPPLHQHPSPRRMKTVCVRIFRTSLHLFFFYPQTSDSHRCVVWEKIELPAALERKTKEGIFDESFFFPYILSILTGFYKRGTVNGWNYVREALIKFKDARQFCHVWMRLRSFIIRLCTRQKLYYL